ncbi:MAG TPA: c-type cytochrome [Rhizomicrobium sp.]|nr:c-type cytochrome [Rhizomicrobium sp.]
MRWLVMALALLCAAPADAQMEAPHNLAGGRQACEGCHGPRGNSESQTIPRLNGQQADYIFSRVGQLLDMPSQPTGSQISSITAEAEAQALAAIAGYFAGQTPSPRRPGRLAETGKRLYENGDPAHFVMACASCHGANGEGHGAVPRLAGQHASYLEHQLGLFSSGLRENRLMHFNTLDLSDDEIEALASYLAGD